MVKIRLFKTGTKHKLSYRIVACDSRKKRNGAVLEIVGLYDPKTKPPTIKVDAARIKYWLKNGAQLSPTVRKLIENEKIS